MKKLIKEGYSLIELILVLAIMSAMMISKVESISQDNISNQAKILADEIRTVSDATNAYIVMDYSNLSKLSDSGTICSSDGICSLSISALQKANLLPPNYLTQTVLRQPYIIQIKRTGSNPNYMMSGLVLTSAKDSRNDYSPVLAGQAIKYIGEDGGINSSDGKISGLYGKWSATSADFPTLSGKTNYVGSVVGSLSGAYYVYLRRDGTLPMTGDLDMGQHSINNANDISASADITAGGIISATGNLVTHKQVVAQDGYGDTMTIGGNGSGGDYKITMNANRPLRIYNPNAGSYTTVLNVDHNVKIAQRLGLMGTDPNNLPSGWGGGLTTFDAYANGTVATGTNGNIAAGMNSAGNIWATNAITGGSLVSNGTVTASGNISTSQSVYANDLVQSGYIHSTGNVDANNRVNAGEYVYINGQGTVGGSCSPNGLQSRTSDGQILSCVNGVWKSSDGVETIPGDKCPDDKIAIGYYNQIINYYCNGRGYYSSFGWHEVDNGDYGTMSCGFGGNGHSSGSDKTQASFGYVNTKYVKCA